MHGDRGGIQTTRPGQRVQRRAPFGQFPPSDCQALRTGSAPNPLALPHVRPAPGPAGLSPSRPAHPPPRESGHPMHSTLPARPAATPGGAPGLFHGVSRRSGLNFRARRGARPDPGHPGRAPIACASATKRRIPVVCLPSPKLLALTGAGATRTLTRKQRASVTRPAAAKSVGTGKAAPIAPRARPATPARNRPPHPPRPPGPRPHRARRRKRNRAFALRTARSFTAAPAS